MSWLDTTFCGHGRSFAQPCDYCEIVGLKDSLQWMQRRVKADEKRLAELLEKTNPSNQELSHDR